MYNKELFRGRYFGLIYVISFAVTIFRIYDIASR